MNYRLIKKESVNISFIQKNINRHCKGLKPKLIQEYLDSLSIKNKDGYVLRIIYKYQYIICSIINTNKLIKKNKNR